jgi:hypothetical protein
MPAALPYIQVASAAVGLAKALQKPKTPKSIGYPEAELQAKATLGPLYDQRVTATLENLDRNAIARGFFGQLPAEALNRSTAAQIRGQQAADEAGLANQMVGQSQQYALAAAAQASAQQQSIISSLLGLSNSFGAMNQQAYNQTGESWWGRPADTSYAAPADLPSLSSPPMTYDFSPNDPTYFMNPSTPIPAMPYSPNDPTHYMNPYAQ